MQRAAPTGTKWELRIRDRGPRHGHVDLGEDGDVRLAIPIRTLSIPSSRVAVKGSSSYVPMRSSVR